MKEDAQLICPISFHDPSGCVWSTLQQSITERLPLRDISWKSTGTVSLSQGCVERLPLRFMPSTASLFKDTDHPFRWFLAPYGNLYFVNIDSIDLYKDAKLAIKKWLETVVGLKRASWLLVYAPVSVTSKAVDAVICGKIYAKLCSDFYVERPGDRSVNFSNVTIASISTEVNVATAYEDFFSKVKEGVIASFFQRCALYDSDIRRLDSSRGSPQFDFRQLFLVKESLALMYQLMQLPQEALRQYGELEALLGVVPEGTLPRDDWPLVVPEDVRATQKGASSPTPTPQVSVDGVSQEAADSSSQSDFDLLWKDPLVEGESVLLYSINSARMRILKNKIGLRELRRYAFSRQMHFLAQQRRFCDFASKGVQFVSDTYGSILHQMAVESDVDRHRRQQADLWAVCAAVRIVRTCRVHLSSQSQHELRNSKSDHPTSISPMRSSEGGDSPVSPPLSSVPMETESTSDAVEAVEAVLLKKIALSRELQLLQEAAIPLSDLLHLAIGSLHSLCMSVSSSQPVPFTPYRKPSYYRERALSIALSLTPTEESLYGTWRGVAVTDSETARSSTALSDVRKQAAAVDGALSVLVEDALLSDLDKALSLFPTHLRMVLSSSRVAGDEKGEGGEGQISPKAGLAQWSPLCILLHRTIGAHEELAGRNRTACRSMLDCGDLLLCHDFFELASTCYSQGMGNRERGQGQRSGSRGSASWEDLERISLLKVLYCAASSSDRAAYMATALSLHGLRSRRTSCLAGSSESHSMLSADVDDLTEDGRFLEPAGIHPLQPYFEINGDCSSRVCETSSAETGSEIWTERESERETTGLPSPAHDVRILRPDAHCRLRLSILSLFPCIVEVDEVSVVYESRPKDSALPARYFTATSPAAQEVGSITLCPSVQKAISLSFVAPSSTSDSDSYGDFSVSEVRVLIRDPSSGHDGTCFLQRRTQIEYGTSVEGAVSSPAPCTATAHDAVGSCNQSLCRLPAVTVNPSRSAPAVYAGQPDSTLDPLSNTAPRAAEICVCASLPAPPIQFHKASGRGTSSAPSASSSSDVPTPQRSFQFVVQIELRNTSAFPRKLVGFRIQDGVFDISETHNGNGAIGSHASKACDTFPSISGAESRFEVSLIGSPGPVAVDSSAAIGSNDSSGAGKRNLPLHDSVCRPVLLHPGDCYCVSLVLSMVPHTPTSPERRGTGNGSNLSLDNAGQCSGPSLAVSFDGGGEAHGQGHSSKEGALGTPTELTVLLAPSCQWMAQRLLLPHSQAVSSMSWTESLLASCTLDNPAVGTRTAGSSLSCGQYPVPSRSSEKGGDEVRVSREVPSERRTGEARRGQPVHSGDLMQRVLTKAIRVDRSLSSAP